MEALILAAGEGSRLRPFTFSRPKHLIPLLGKPMIQYAIEDLMNSGIHDVGVVTGYFGDMIREALGDGSNFGMRFTYIVQERRLGIAHAIYRAIEDGFLNREFVVYLGDNILSDGIAGFVKSFREGSSDVHILLTRVRDPSNFGVAVLSDGKVIKLVEKPKEYLSDTALVGVYMFRDPHLVINAFKSLKPSWRGEYEVTELIQWFIDRGYKVTFSEISGWWKDVGTYEGLLEAIYLLLDKVKARVEGDVIGNVIGRVVVEKGAKVEGDVHGPAYIGKDVTIGRDVIIEHFVSVESSSKVLSGHITRSIVMDHSEIHVKKARLVDSVIGSRSVVRCSKEVYGDVKLIISDYNKVYL